MAKDEKGANALLGAVQHAGRIYHPDKKKDQDDFAALAAKEGGLAAQGVTDKKERADAHKEELQKLADRGVIRGFGTKAPSKKDKEEEK